MINRPIVIAYTMSVVMLAGLLSLGFWQLQRLAWKENLIAQIEARAEASPIVLKDRADLLSLRAIQHDFTPVRLSGRWLYAQQQYWFAQIATPPAGMRHGDHIGFHVITPLELSDGSVVLVDRGYIPTALKNTPERFNTSPTEIDGVARWPSPRSVFDNADQPDRGIWYVRDPEAMAAAVGLETVPFLIEQTTSNGDWPIADQTRRAFSNRHLEYAVTWFSLALTLVIILILWHIRQRRAFSANHQAKG